MASHASAAKRARQNVCRAQRNTARLSRVKTAVKRFREAIVAGDATVLRDTFLRATRALRQAASKGVMHRRTASRRVSRLALAHKAAVARAQAA